MTRIKETLYRDIAAGKFHETGKLPGVRELAERFNCSRGTVANALKLLANDGIVRLEHGRGTFVEEVKRPPVTKNNRVIGAVLLWYSWMEEMEKVRAKYLKDDWLISLYCSSKDLQNPQEERHFLELAREQNFSGVILTGSPIEPLNTNLYYSLRKSGMKILHLTNYKEDMTQEAAILPDYRMAGALAASTAALQGKKKIVTVSSTPFAAPSTKLRNAGAISMAKALNLEILPELLIHTEQWVTTISSENMKKFLDNCGQLEDVALLVNGCAMLNELQIWMAKNGIPKAEQPFALSMTDTHPLSKELNHISFNYAQSIKLAMDYMTNELIDPLEPYTVYLDPILKLVSK